MTNPIYPCLWFDGQAQAAANLYCSIMKSSRIVAASPMVVNFELYGQKFMGLNGGPMYKINPSISFFIRFDNEAELDNVWNPLAEGGEPLLPLNKYPWSEKYGWIKDRFGVTWQLMLDKSMPITQKIIPSLLFTEKSHGKGNAAIDFYTSLFPQSTINVRTNYLEGESNYATTGMLKYSNFNLKGSAFTIMDAGFAQPYSFNEAISFVVECEDQQEIDQYWNALSENGQEQMCGWVKDQFGVCWQIVPKILGQLMGDPAKGSRVIQAFLKMKKFDIQTLVDA